LDSGGGGGGIESENMGGGGTVWDKGGGGGIESEFVAVGAGGGGGIESEFVAVGAGGGGGRISGSLVCFKGDNATESSDTSSSFVDSVSVLLFLRRRKMFQTFSILEI